MEVLSSDAISTMAEKIFEKACSGIKFDPTNKMAASEDIKKIIATAFNNIKKYEFCTKFTKEDIVSLLINNQELICQWLYNPFTSKFSSDEIAITNYDLSQESKDFLNAFFSYIQSHKNEYPSFCLQAISSQITNSTNQINSSLNNMNCEFKQDFNQVIKMLKQTQESLSIKTTSEVFKDDFNKIDSLLNTRKTNDANIILNHIREKVLKTSNDEIIEAFYMLYTKFFMLTYNDDSTELIESLNQLISYTKEGINKEYRIALLHIYKKEYNTALEIINKNLKDNFKLYMELNAFLLLNTNQFETLASFLTECDEKFRLLWEARLLLNQQKYKEAYDIVTSKEFLIYEEYDYVFVELQIKTYYYLSISSNVKSSTDLKEKCIKLIEKIDKTLLQVENDTITHSELLTDKMLLSLLLDKIDYSNIDNYINELDSLNCQNPNYLKNKAIYFMTKKDYKTAFEILDAWCIKYPDAIETKELRAIAFYSFDPKRAREEFNKLDNNPENITIKIKIFYSYMKEYNFSEAHKWLLDFSKNNISSFYIYAAFGDYYLQMGDAQLAYSNYLSAIKSNDGYYSKLDYYAQLLRLTCQSLDPQKFNECIQFKDLLDNHDMIKIYYNEIASVYLTFKAFDEALIVVHKAKQINGNTPSINYLEMLCYVNKQDYNKVIEIYMDSNDDIQVKEDINQKYKIFINAAIQCNKEIEKAKNLYQILEKPSAEEDYKQHTYYAEHFSTPQEYVKLCLEGINKYPNSIILLKNFLLSCINTKLHLKDIELYKTYKEIEQKYISLPENGKTNRLGVGII